MIAVIALCPAAPEKPRLFRRGAPPFKLQVVSAGAARLLLTTVFLPPRVKARKKALSAAAKKLRDEGIRKAVYPEGFADEDIFAGCGVASLNDYGLYPEIAAKIALFAGRYVTGKEESALSAAVYANRVSPAVRRAVIELGANTARITLLGKADDRRLKSMLMHDFGVPAAGGNLARDECADVLLLFDLPEEELIDRNPAKITVNLSGRKTGRINEICRARVRLPEKLCSAFPQGIMSNQLVFAILESGGVSAKELSVDSIDPIGHYIE